MAIEKRKRKSGMRYRAIWRNPYTGKIEKGEMHAELAAAKRDDDLVKYRLKHEPHHFMPSDSVVQSSVLYLSDLLHEHLTRNDITDSTRKSDFYHIKAVLEACGDLPAEKVTSEKMDLWAETYSKWHEKTYKKTPSANSWHRKLTIIRSVINKAFKKKRLAANPLLGHVCPKSPPKKTAPPTSAEIRKLVRLSPPHLARFILLSYYFGARPGESEILCLKWSDFDPEQRRMRIWSAQKNKQMPWRYAYVSEVFWGVFSGWWQEDMAAGIKYLITWKGHPVKSIKGSWAMAKKKAGITRNFRPYDLRHAFATEALANGADAKAVAEQMGHQDTTMIHHHYQHVLDSQRRKVADSIPDVLSESSLWVQDVGTNQPHSDRFTYPQKKLVQ